MKNLKMTLAIAIVTAGMSSCNEENEFIETRTNMDEEVVNKIVEMGFRADMIDHDGTNGEYILEGDMVFTKDHFISDKDHGHGKTDQARTDWLVFPFLVNNITVRIHSSIPTSGNDNWRPAITAAINDWNSRPSSVRFVLTTSSSANITIRSDQGALANNVIADAKFPFVGFAGDRIRINLNFLSNMNVPFAVKRRNMVHELGHCIGFRHTNWLSRGESSAIQIPGTPLFDGNSVMNGGTALTPWSGFSVFDTGATAFLYPN